MRKEMVVVCKESYKVVVIVVVECLACVCLLVCFDGELSPALGGREALLYTH